jgi:hypothetical protein
MQYIPVQEDFVIQLGNKYCALESVVGPFNFVISGRINSWDAATGVMDFQFTAVDILLFGNKVSVAAVWHVLTGGMGGSSCNRALLVTAA